MSRKLILLLIVIGLGLSMIACTSGRSQRYPYPRYPGPGYPNYPGNYPGYPGYPGGNNNQFEQVQTLANHLKDATAEVMEEAKEEPADELQQSTIAKLEELDEEAKDFQDNIGDRSSTYGYGDPRYGDPRYGDPRYGDPRYGNSRHPGGEKFTELLQKYYSARNTLRELPREDDVQKDFERVTGIMRNLTRLYGYQFEPDREYLEPTIR